MSGIFFRLLFKAMVPVIMLVGLMSYMMYMQGQDPLAPLKSVASGLGEQYDQANRSMRRSVANAGDLLPHDDEGEAAGSTQRIYRWEDADGVTHFGTFKPESEISYQTVEVDTKSNVMDAFDAPSTGRKQLTAQAEKTPQPARTAPVPMSANPVKIREMLNDVNKLSESRLQKLEAIQ